MALKKGSKPMVQRRDILKTSLTLCGCAASGALGAEARADGPVPRSNTFFAHRRGTYLSNLRAEARAPRR
jgi:hypothetical protein